MKEKVNNYISGLVWLTAVTAFFWACSGGEVPEQRVPLGSREYEEAFIASNKYLVELEEEAIDDFIERYGWTMQRTGSGLRYKIHHEGEGMKASYGDIAVIEYRVYLITGELIYSSYNEGVRSFTVGRGGVESGLEEGILMMRKGDRATFIMPSHLAHGVPGDGNKIPKRASIVYKVELVNLF